MNIEKLIRFGFASRKRKLLTLTLAAVAGIGAMFGGGGEESKRIASTATTSAARCEATSPLSSVPCDTEGRTMGEYLRNHPLTSPTSPTTTTTGSEPYYQNCQAAKDAGAAPLHRGEPGYRSALDRDGDGVACDK